MPLQPLQDSASPRPPEPAHAYARPSAPVYVAAPAAAQVRPVSGPDASARIVEVKSGDTLYGISRRHGLKVEQLMEANSLSSTNLQVGQKLTLP